MVFICSTLRLPAWVNDFPQDSHLKSLSPSWTVLVYPLRELAWVNSFPQDSHLKFLSPSWTVLICPLRESAWANYVSSDMIMKIFNVLRKVDIVFKIVVTTVTFVWINKNQLLLTTLMIQVHWFVEHLFWNYSLTMICPIQLLGPAIGFLAGPSSCMGQIMVRE